MSKLSVHLRPGTLSPAGTAAAAEVLDEELRRVAVLLVVAGERRETEVPPGVYTVRVELPSGEGLERRVDVGDGPATVDLGEVQAPAERPGLLRRMGDGLRAIRSAHARPRIYDGVVWEFGPGGRWERGVDVQLSVDEPISLEVEPGRRQALAVSGPGAREEILPLPPGAVAVAFDLGSAGKTLATEITPAGTTAAALSSYLATDRLDLSATVVDELLRQNVEARNDPALETLVGYHLIRTGDHERLADWRNRSRAGAAIVDQLILEAWSLLRSGKRQDARTMLLRAGAAGPPVYRDGLRLLLDGLRLVLNDESGAPDRAVTAALDKARNYALATNWSEPLTSFPGTHPEEPEPAPARVAGEGGKPWSEPNPEHRAFSERRLHALLTAHAGLSAVVTLVLAAGIDSGWFGSTPAAVALGALLTLLSVLGAADVRRFGWLTLILAAAYLVLIYVATLEWVLDGAEPVSAFGLEVPGAIALPAWLIPSTVVMVALFRWGIAAARAANDLRYLHPIAYSGLVALAEVLVDVGPKTVPAAEVARNVDRHLAQVKNRSRRTVQMALIALTLLPAIRLSPPLPALDPESRKRLLRRLIDRAGARRGRNPAHASLQGVIRVASQMVYLGYYGDPRSWPSIGYVPPRERKGGATEAVPSGAPPRPLAVPPRGGRRGYDTIVVGSGPAGAVLAYRLAEAGRRVLLVERGPYVRREQLEEDEAGRFLHLYSESGLETTTDFGLQIVQGACLGGGSTLHRGVALHPPDSVLDAWAAHGLDRSSMQTALREVETWLGVGGASDPKTGFEPLTEGIRRLGLAGRLESMNRELSMLQTVLPWAQRDFPDLVEVLADCHVERIVASGNRAVGVAGRHVTGMDVAIPAEEVVVAAGAIGSSWLLLRSRLGGENVGRGLHFNLGCDVTGDFDDPLDEPTGAIVYVPEGADDFLVETWSYPPVMQAISMPGWFDQHVANMRRSRHMTRAGVLVGTTVSGRLRATRHGPLVDYTAAPQDVRRLIEGLRLTARVFLAAGAIRVMPSTFAWHECRSEKALEGLLPVLKPYELQLSSVHPQGGNAIGAVVEDDFRLRGMENVYVCDASVMPTSVQVEPQLTVMALAQLAAKRIAGR